MHLWQHLSFQAGCWCSTEQVTKLILPSLQDFGEHGREFITSEVGLRFLQVLGDPEQLSKLVGGGKRAARLQAILQQCAFKVGHTYSTTQRGPDQAHNRTDRPGHTCQQEHDSSDT